MLNKFIIKIERINNNKLQNKVTFEIPEDSDLDDWKYLFTAILANVSFDIDQIKDFFNREVDDEEIKGN